jgi:hypothetical protein
MSPSIAQLLDDDGIKGPCLGAVTYSHKTREFTWGYAAKLETVGLAERPHLTAQILTDVTAIELQEISKTRFLYTQPYKSMFAIVREAPVDLIKGKFDVTPLTAATPDVKELEEPESKAPVYQTLDYECKKDVARWDVSDEARMMGVQTMTFQIDEANIALTRLLKDRIIQIAQDSAQTLAGHDWASNNPNTDFSAAKALISGTDDEWIPDFAAANPTVWDGYFSSNYVKGTHQDTRRGETENNILTFTVPGQPGIVGIQDPRLDATSMLMGSSLAPAILWIHGPSEARKHRSEEKGAVTYVFRDWNDIQLCKPTAICRLTGVHS